MPFFRDRRLRYICAERRYLLDVRDRIGAFMTASGAPTQIADATDDDLAGIDFSADDGDMPITDLPDDGLSDADPF